MEEEWDTFFLGSFSGMGTTEPVVCLWVGVNSPRLVVSKNNWEPEQGRNEVWDISVNTVGQGRAEQAGQGSLGVCCWSNAVSLIGGNVSFRS